MYSRSFLCEEAKIKQSTSSKKQLCGIGEEAIWESRIYKSRICENISIAMKYRKYSWHISAIFCAAWVLYLIRFVTLLTRTSVIKDAGYHHYRLRYISERKWRLVCTRYYSARLALLRSKLTRQFQTFWSKIINWRSPRRQRIAGEVERTLAKMEQYFFASHYTLIGFPCT